MTNPDLTDVAPLRVEIGGAAAQLDLPVGWTVAPGPPLAAMPVAWNGEPPGVVVSIERDALRGDALAAVVAEAALTRLADPVVVSLALHDPSHDGDVEVIVAHQHRGVDVTTVERHHCHPGPIRWVVGCTIAHHDVPRMLPFVRRIAASLRQSS